MDDVHEAQAVEELGDRISGEDDEPPEDEGMRQPGERSAGNGRALSDDVDQEAADSNPGVVEGQRVRGGGDQPEARGDLPREPTGKRQDQQPEDERLHIPLLSYSFNAAVNAGTTSKRSPTTP